MDITETLKIAVWKKGTFVFGIFPNEIRKDTFGTLMKFNQFGNRNNTYGWEIDHIIPQDKNGTDELFNLQPLQWENNLKKSNKILKPFFQNKLFKKPNLFDFRDL